MTEVISVRFKSGGKTYYFAPGEGTFPTGEGVIVETAKGIEYGECTQGNTQVDDRLVVSPLRPVVRRATEDDLRAVEANRKRAAQAFRICQEKIAEHGLDMKLVDVEYGFERSKMIFFFTSDGRVDFRELVKDLAGIFRTRIELRQIGVRDEAKLLGGLGICGKPFCCSTFLSEFQPVSIKMAKTQNLSLNPAKISGTCGRLMCCLKYEQEAYEDLLSHTPKMDSFVETPDGGGVVSGVSLLRENVKVQLDISPESPRVYPAAVVRVIRSGKGKRPEGYSTPEELRAAHMRETMEKARRDYAAASAAASAAREQSERRRAPEAGEAAAQPGPRSARRRRGGRPRAAEGEGAAVQQQPKPQSPQQPKPQTQKPAKEQPKPQETGSAEGGDPKAEKTAKNRRNYRRRRPKKPGGGNGGGAPQA